MKLSALGLKSRIRETHVGDPLAHRQEGAANSVSLDRLALAADLPVSDAEDKQVGEFGFLRLQVLEAFIETFGLGECTPVGEGAAFLEAVLRGSRFIDVVEAKAEISLETTSGGNVSIFQGVGCGYFCWKRARKATSVRCWRREASSAMPFSSPGTKKASWQHRCARWCKQA